MNRLTSWADGDFDLAYIYARGYYDGRVNGYEYTNIGWMSPVEVAIYARGYDRGVADFDQYGEEIETGRRK
jgi:hypothetical protein